jgi:hypothetical protein
VAAAEAAAAAAAAAAATATPAAAVAASAARPAAWAAATAAPAPHPPHPAVNGLAVEAIRLRSSASAGISTAPLLPAAAASCRARARPLLP